MDHVKSGIRIRVTPGDLILKIVVTKLIAVNVEEAPSMNWPATQKSVPGTVEASDVAYGTTILIVDHDTEGMQHVTCETLRVNTNQYFIFHFPHH